MKSTDKINLISKDTQNLIASYRITVSEDEWIAGPSRLYDKHHVCDKEEEFRILGHDANLGEDYCHSPTNTFFLHAGIGEIIRRAEITACSSKTELQRAYAQSIADVYTCISDFILKHAKLARRLSKENPDKSEHYNRIARNCEFVSHEAPKTMEQAIQLYYFIWFIRFSLSPYHRVEVGRWTCPLGRIDQQLYPYYKNDIKSKVLNRESARDLISQMWDKIVSVSEGDTLCNVMLGGCDENGKDQTNELSMLMLETIISRQRGEPHINVRIHKNSPSEFVNKALTLIGQGQGQGTIYFDDIQIPSLVNYGIPLKTAANYCNDGCEEVVFDGESNIVFFEIDSPKVIELTMFNGQENPYIVKEKDWSRWDRNLPLRHNETTLTLGYKSGDVQQAKSFEEVYEAFLKQFSFQIDQGLKILDERYTTYANEGYASPVLGGTNAVCVDEGCDPILDAVSVPVYQLHSGSIPMLADCLTAIKTVVFEAGYCTMKELCDAMAMNFDGYENLRQRLLRAPKFGNGIEIADSFASELSRLFCQQVKDYQPPFKGHYLPGLYSILFEDMSKLTKATPDGRKWGDPVSVHYSPVPGRATEGPTAMIRSVGTTNLAAGAAASPVYLTLPRSLIPENSEGYLQLHWIVQAAEKYGIPIFSIAINDVKVLRDAQKHPELHEDVIVRVWGFNARFVDLTPSMQEHVILRTLE